MRGAAVRSLAAGNAPVYPSWAFAAAAVLAAAAAAAATLFPLQHLLTEGPVLCPVRLSTGLLCPGCGSTRALAAVLRGDVLQALGYNPLAAAASPFLLVAFVRQGARVLGGSDTRTTHLPAELIWGLLLVVVVYTVLRNLPWDPFVLLAP